MKSTFKVLGIISLMMVIGFSMAACGGGDDDGGGSGGGSGSSGNNPFIGTWTDGWLTVTCSASTWRSVDSVNTFTGSYTRNGNTATFKETNGNTFGTASVSGNEMTVVSANYGTFYLTKTR